MKALVIGFGITSQAVVMALLERGHDVIVVDDRPGEAAQDAAIDLGLDLVVAPTPEQLGDLVAAVDVVLPSPGVPDHHPVFALAERHGRGIRSEFDLASEWDDRPLVAITGTNGKTTVTTLVADMLDSSGRRAVAVGNTGIPLVAAIADPLVDVFVVEASSFRLAHSRHFAPRVAAWLNFAPDHLDAHATLVDYEAAKARIWSDQGPDDIAVVNLEDPVVAAYETRARRVTYGLSSGDYTMGVNGELLTPGGDVIVRSADLWRALPHDLSNALAASAIAVSSGATLQGVHDALVRFRGLPHRVELVTELGGVRWYDDSKATTPSAASSAIGGFDSIVLIAGGRNKGLDLDEMASGASRVKAVVAIGESADVVSHLFEGRVGQIVQADSMQAAVRSSADIALPGDVVLLSPGCASFDWYGSYPERGRDFAQRVLELEDLSS
ncbi:MAG: UDP-N-acetylmuramoyl-L-alanine--D-glutamate ligase [Actinomycetia bacterium]|nr:UDP-N-acetylmuramoyl-L-alanine--D-glutamate ligase [Actinomycetes bacterium]MCP3913869.1 UDP-N-acetylmuramoyl-L-alanine--D-glutamate ligase [Actinomycetes bacterium]MCP4084251.1 UDP-N-acetylmuramoyl-L-alanine--D-glutamate ligase [Actinomycetes bacterium]